MAAKSSSSSKGDTGAPKRRRVKREPVERAEQAPFVERGELESEGNRPASDFGEPVASAPREERQAPVDDFYSSEGDSFGSGVDDNVPDHFSEIPDLAHGDHGDEFAGDDIGSGEGEEGGGSEGEDGQRRRRRRRRRSRSRGANLPEGEQQHAAAPQPAARPQGHGRQQGQARPQGQGRPQPNRPQSNRPQGNRPQSNRPQSGGRPQNTRMAGNQPRRGGGSLEQNGSTGGPVIGTTEGVLELHPKGYGFLRDPKNNYAAGKTDTFVSSTLIEKHRLREGILIRGDVVVGTKGQGPRLKSIESIDGRTVEEYQQLKSFDELTAINPFEQIKLEIGPTPVTMRVMDLLTPIGKGQRALIVAPPRTGKTMLLQEIANSVSINHPELHLMVLLIDERPEEVTEMRRRIRGEVIASSMDRDVESHVRIAQLIVERGKRIAEAGGEVFVLLDSITRTARAFNKWIGSSGRTTSGGLDIRALDIPKKLFGTARRFDEGGSLTVAATALIETGSRMDDVIFQEFKGTGNMELVLNRQLADRRIWPSIDIQQSGTRREEKILSPEVLEGVTLLRRSLVSLNPIEAMEQLIKTLGRFPSNVEFLAKIRSIM
jgi:transcription termination factor Rho